MAGTFTASRQEVYDLLKRRITHLAVLPGQKISETQIAGELQVSRTPVREALVWLTEQALVQVLPQKGTFVTRIDLERVTQERFLRESIETGVLRLFTKDPAPTFLESLKECIRLQDRALKERDLPAFFDQDDLFHGIFFTATGQQLSHSIIEQYSGHYRRIRYLSMYLEDVSSQNIRQHEALVAAIERRDEKEVLQLFTEHTGKLLLERQEICSRYPDYFEPSGTTGSQKRPLVSRAREVFSQKPS